MNLNSRGPDVSQTNWFVAAIFSAENAGLLVEQPNWSSTVNRAANYLTSLDAENGASTIYCDRRLAGWGRGLPPASVLSRIYLGEPGHSESIETMCANLLAHPLDWESHTYYDWYWITRFFHACGGDAWHRWSQNIQAMFAKNQSIDGHWSSANSPWGKGWDLYSTTFALMILQMSDHTKAGALAGR